MSCSNRIQIYIPNDLQIKTLSRLPVKSLLRFQCVSKLWCSIITSQDLKNQHMKIIASPSAPSRLLISIPVSSKTTYENQLMLVSSPNPNASFYRSASCHVPYSDIDLNLLHVGDKMVHNSVRGLICVGGRNEVEIWNPSTRQKCFFPQMSISGSVCPSTDYFFGYDPVEDQYKVLAFNVMRLILSRSFVVLRGDGVWREVPWFGYMHIAQTSGICIDGVLYYGATRTDNKTPILVSFDVRLETFNIIKVPKVKEYDWYYDVYTRDFSSKTLINFWGKIGVIEKPRNGSFRMWVLKDAEKEEWFMNEYRLPKSIGRLDLDVMSYFYAGEICLVPKELSDPFRLYFYNLKMECTRYVVLEGLPISVFKEVSDHGSVTVSNLCDSFFKFLKS